MFTYYWIKYHVQSFVSAILIGYLYLKMDNDQRNEFTKRMADMVGVEFKPN